MKSILVSLMALTAIATSMQSASAQEQQQRGARFNYSPNVWKSESVRLPKGYGATPDPVHSVRSGSVPTGNVLGLDPSMLAKPAAPAPVIAARPAMTSVTPAMFIPKTNSNFNPMFGKPQVAQAMPAAPFVPQQAVAQSAKPMSAAPAHSAPRGHAQGLSGRMLTKPRHYAPSAAPTSAVAASYPTGFGYTPGPVLSSGGNGSSVSTALNGRILGRNHK